MELTDKVYTDKKGFARVLPSKQRVADLMFRINSGWSTEETSADRGVAVEEVKTAIDYYKTREIEVNTQISQIYGDWKIEIPKGCEPIFDRGKLVGYRSIKPGQSVNTA